MAFPSPRRSSRPLAVCAAFLLLAVAACSSGGPTSSKPSGRLIQVAAAENFWGSIAGEIGGSHVHVTNIITNPNADPHSYEPTPKDARTVAFAQMVVENGIGYDPWMGRLLAADTGGRTVLNVGRLLRLRSGSNPHRWYNPSDVQAVVAAMVADYSRLDPADSAYFQQQRVIFNTVDLRQYNSLIAEIRAVYAGTPVGASESMFSMLAPALELRIVTPYSFLKAISEGTDVSPADRSTVDRQIKKHEIKIYVYNVQNTTPDVQAVVRECKAEGIPTAEITETLVPASATYGAWQTRQLEGILNGLRQAVAR